MKQFLWMLCGVFLSGLLLGTLSGCGADSFPPVVITTSPGEAAPAPEEPPEDEARRLAYANLLEEAYLHGVLPDGTELEWVSEEEAAKNQFALADVDGDGAEELVLYWSNACMAGMTGVVFGYRDGGVYEELTEFPALTFYPGGAVTADWSHNQGWANRFWPYTLYQYNREQGVYETVASVDAWDLSCTEGDEALTAAFPREADADADGLVYYILIGEWYEESRTPSDGNLDGRLWGTDPVNRAEVDAWLNAYTGGEEPLQLSFQELTVENISDLGYWSIPGPAQEPLG